MPCFYCFSYDSLNDSVNKDNNQIINGIHSEDSLKTNIKEPSSNEELTDDDVDDGCSTTIIQGFNNDSVLSYRRDATNKLTINIRHDQSLVRQYKDNSYFFHVLVNKDGWMVGNGGADNANVNHAIENNALEMINRNAITQTNMNNIYSQESRLSLGHFVIKAPDGRFSLIIKNGGRVYKDSGILKAGSYLVVPNSVTYYKKGTLNKITNTDSLIKTSISLSAHDAFGVNRRGIATYYYRNNLVNSTVQVSVANDNGKYVGRRTSNLIDNIRTNNNYYASSTIPVIDKTRVIDNINFFIRKTKTTVSTDSIVTNGSRVKLVARVKDEFKRNITGAYVYFVVDNKTCYNSNNTVLRKKLVNGYAYYETKINNVWTNHSYYVCLIPNSYYEGSSSKSAYIKIVNPITLKSSHSPNMYYGGNLSILTKIAYSQNNSPVNTGKVYYKINGKTVKNSQNNTLTKRIINSTAIYNIMFDSRYSAGNYNLTVVYVNGNYKKELTKRLTINKIPVKITNSSLSVKKRMIYFSARLTDSKNKIIKLNTYLSIKIDSKTLKNANNTRIFNIKGGKINFKFTIPKGYKKGTHRLTIVLPKDKTINSLTKNYTFTLKSI